MIEKNNADTIIRVEIRKILAKLKLMINDTISQHDLAKEAIANANHQIALKILDNDLKIDSRYDEIESDLTFLLTMRPLAKELRRTLAYLFIARELERIADYSKHIAKFVIKETSIIDLSSKTRIRNIHKPLRVMLSSLYEVIKSENPERARNLALQDAAINQATLETRKDLIASIAKKTSESAVSQRVFVLNVINSLERAADHIVSVCEIVTYIYIGKHSALG